MTFERLAGEERDTATLEVFGEGASAEEAFGLLTVDVPAASWTGALAAARDVLGCTYFDWLSAVDEPGEGFAVVAHLAAVGTPVRRLLLRTRVPHDTPALPTATGVYAGAAWHERETHEMFGIDFPGHPHLVPLLLPEGFEGHPLRKDFVLAARVAKAWPGAKEPGESDHGGGARRRQMLPPGVPDPNEWGPMKGKLAPAESAGARAARGARTAGAARSAGSAGSGGSAASGGSVGAPGEGAARGPRADRPRRTRSASAGSVSQARTEGAGGKTPPAGTPGTAPPSRGEGAGDAARTTPPGGSRPAPREERAADAPWERPASSAPEGPETSDRRDRPEGSETPDRPGSDRPKGPDAPESRPGASEEPPDSPQADTPTEEGP